MKQAESSFSIDKRRKPTGVSYAYEHPNGETVKRETGGYSLKTSETTNGKRAGINAGALLEDGVERAQLRI
jgi:hypothetical protein